MKQPLCLLNYIDLLKWNCLMYFHFHLLLVYKLLFPKKIYRNINYILSKRFYLNVCFFYNLDNKENIISILGASFNEKYSTQRFYSTLQGCKILCLRQAQCTSFNFRQTNGLCLLSNLTFSQLNLEAENSRWSSYQFKGIYYISA